MYVHMPVLILIGVENASVPYHTVAQTILW